MKVLVITNQGEDYLADMVLYGLRKRYGAGCVDVPRKDVMYKSCTKEKIYGRGFTMWRLLDEVDVNRDGDLRERVGSGEFDLVVFSSIHRQAAEFMHLRDVLREARFLDGEDDDSRSLYSPALETGHPYFKREKTEPSQRVLPVSFGIPGEKMLATTTPKTRLFASHVQSDIAFRHPWIKQNCRDEYVFEREADYRADMAASRFAITRRKGGWDCMRHYEQAANLAVPCFHDLQKKPHDCAPHGLIDGVNCISWSTVADLRQKTDRADYERLIHGVQDWISDRTCEKLADYVVNYNNEQYKQFGPR